MTKAAAGMPIEVEFEGTGCDWSVVVETDRQYLSYKPAAFSYVGDAWEVRDLLFSIRTEADALQFLQTTGFFAVPDKDLGSPLDFQAGIFQLADVLEWRDILKTLLVTPVAEWGNAYVAGDFSDVAEDSSGIDFVESQPDLSEPMGLKTIYGGTLDTLPELKAIAITRKHRFTVEFRWLTGVQMGIIRTRDTLEAILATLYVSHLRNAKFDYCSFEKCGKAFELTSRHERKYCNRVCQRAALVSRGRRRSANGGRELA